MLWLEIFLYQKNLSSNNKTDFLEHGKTLLTYLRSLTCHSYKLSFTSSTEYIPVEILDGINYALEV